MREILLGGKPLASYAILYRADEAALAVAKALQRRLQSELAVTLPLLSVKEGKGVQNAILLGAEATQNANTYGDYALFFRENAAVIDAADIAGLAAGAARLASLLSSGRGEFCPQYGALQKREEYEQDATAFCPVYGAMCSAPTVRLSLESKREALQNPGGRACVIAHRGEHTFYPENALEGALSAWRCGADAVEVDIQKSADGVWMCMHDSDLRRVTNVVTVLPDTGERYFSTELFDF